MGRDRGSKGEGGREEERPGSIRMPGRNEVILEMDSPVQLPWLIPHGSEMNHPAEPFLNFQAHRSLMK